MWEICVTILFCLLLNSVRSHEGHHHATENHEHPGWGFSADLVKNVGVNFKWNNTDPEFITMEMSSRTNGYVSVGFCGEWKNSMDGCDIVVGWVDDSDHRPYLIDYHAIGNNHPTKDPQQDYELISGVQGDNFLTTITFRRKWNTGDSNDTNLETGNVQLIWSWNMEDGTNDTLKAHDKNSRGHTTTMISLKTPPSATLTTSQVCSSAGAVGKAESLFLLSILIFCTLTTTQSWSELFK